MHIWKVHCESTASTRWSYLSSVMSCCLLLGLGHLEDAELDGAVDDADADRGDPGHEGEGALAGVGSRGERHGCGGGGYGGIRDDDEGLVGAATAGWRAPLLFSPILISTTLLASHKLLTTAPFASKCLLKPRLLQATT